MRVSKFLPAIILGIIYNTALQAEIKPDKVYIAEAKKNKSYIKDGLILGGDRTIEDVVIRDLRRSSNRDFERVVIDLESGQEQFAYAIPRPPYYQISVTPGEKKLVMSIWGSPTLKFDSRRVLSSFKKSSIIKDVMLLPRLESNVWTFAMELRSDAPVEVFELSHPVRIIVDIQRKP